MRTASLLALADAAEALARLARAFAGRLPPTPRSSSPSAKRRASQPRRPAWSARQSEWGTSPAYGGQRDRSVRRRDLGQWIESRKVPVRVGPDDRDMERRMARLEREGRKRRPR